MTQVRLARVFWIGAAAVLIVAALVSIAGILRGDFSETDAKILGTLLTVLLAGGTAIAGLSLVERGVLVPLGWTTAGLSVAGFALIAAAIWNEFENDLGDWSVRAIVVLIALLLVTTQRLMLRGDRFRWLFGATAVAAFLSTALTAAAIGEDGSDLWQAIAILWILTGLGYLLLPVLQRFTAAPTIPASARVLAELDGVELVATRNGNGLDVRLEHGERLALRRRS